MPAFFLWQKRIIPEYATEKLLHNLGLCRIVINSVGIPNFGVCE